MKYLTTANISIKEIDNLSLFYDKFVISQTYISDKTAAKNEAFDYLIKGQFGSQKNKLYSFILNLISTIGEENYRLIVGKLKSNLAINLATGVFENAGISLDRITSTPYIYGSAIKGCSKHASWKSKEGFDNLDIEVFGSDTSDSDDSSKGGITFIQSFFIKGRLGLDILTPHTQNMPVPNKYPVVKAGSTFAFILILNSKGKRCKKYTPTQLLDRAEESLLKAFELGIGAKTSSGLGWLERDEKEELTIQDQIKEKIDDEKEKAAEEARISAMDPIDLLRENLKKMNENNTIAEFIKELKSKSIEEKKICIELFNSDKSLKDKKKNWKKKKPNLYSILEDVSKEIGINLS